MNNQKNIRIILSPGSKILDFFGLNTSELNHSFEYAIRICYSTCVLFYVILQFLINFKKITALNIKESKQNLYTNIALFCLFGSETFSAISSLAVGIFHYKKKAKINAKLCEVENLLSEFFSFDFSKFRHLQHIVRFALLFLLCCFLFDVITLFFCEPTRRWIILMMHYSVRFVFWVDISYFLLILNILRLYFLVINQELITMSKIFQQNVASDMHEFKKIKIIKRIHYSLKKMFRMQNFLYQWQLSFALLYSASAFTSYTFLFITRNLVGLFSFAELSFRSVVFDVYGVFWLSMNFILHIFILKNISGTLEEGENTIVMLEKLRLEVNSEPIDNFLKYFSRQIFDDKIEFTACGFFTLDYTIIYQIISNSSMYLIILLQFHFSKMYFEIDK